jgi:protein tyrosine/serine phosphatase
MRLSRTFLLIVVLLAPLGISAYVSRSQHYPRRFAEVVPGMYRGGFPTGDHIATLAREKGVKTIVSLTDLKDEAKYAEEMDAAKAAGLRFLRFPMLGDGRGDLDILDRAADAIGDKANWPVFFHCAAGKQRSNAALAAWRVKKCGWPLDKAIKELEDKYDLNRENEAELVDHLQAYAEWIKRPPAAPAKPSKGEPEP